MMKIVNSRRCNNTMIMLIVIIEVDMIMWGIPLCWTKTLTLSQRVYSYTTAICSIGDEKNITPSVAYNLVIFLIWSNIWK